MSRVAISLTVFCAVVAHGVVPSSGAGPESPSAGIRAGMRRAEAVPEAAPAAAPAAAQAEGTPAAGSGPAARSPLPYELQTELEAVMQKKVAALLDERNEDGFPFKRATYSRHFRKVDDATYEVALLQDTASQDSLTTERFLVTLKRDASKDKWSIAAETLQDTYKNLYRTIPGDEEFQKFDGFTFSREGLKVRASKGSLYKDSWNGKTYRFVLVSSDMAFEYTPLERRFQGIHRMHTKDRAKDMLFAPQMISITCDDFSCEDLFSSSFTGLAPSALDAVDERLRNKYEEFLKDLKKARKDTPFAGFRSPLEPGRRAYSITLSAESPDRGASLAFDTWEPREVTFSVYGMDRFYTRPFYEPVYLCYSEETLSKGIDPRELEMRDDAYARDYDLVGLSGTVELALEDAETLSADVTFSLKTKRDLREMPFFITRVRQTEKERKEAKDPQLLMNSIEDAEGRELTWVKTGAASGIIIFPKEIPAGTPVTLHMSFENKAAIRNFSSTFSYVSRFGWLPFVRFTDMINDFSLTIKVPGRYQVLGIGTKVSDTVEKGVRTARFVADSPVEFPSITFGEYQSVESNVEAKKIDGTKIPVVIHVDRAGLHSPTREYIPITGKSLQYFADQAANSLNLFREVYGVDYPYGKLDLVNDPLGFFYGQSPSSLVYLGEGTFWSQGTAGDIGGGNLSKFNREVVPHEIGHQWWGSLIPNHNDGNYWFVESLAEYSSALFVEYAEGEDDRKAYQEKVEDWRRAILESDLQASVQDASVVWSGGIEGGYQAAVYNKGPYAFHVMRMTWGDEKFFKFLKMLTQELRNKAIVTRDIQRIAEKAFGGNMDFFFDQWFRGVGQPEYTFNYSVRQTEDGKYLVEGHVDQRVLVGHDKDVLDGTYFTAVIPVTVTAKGGKEYRFPIRVEGAQTSFRFKIAESPKEIVFNKYGESLAYDVIVKQTS